MVDLNKFKIKNIDDLNIKKLKLLKLDKKNPLIGMVARYDRQKGHKILLKSLFKLKERKKLILIATLLEKYGSKQ